METSALSPQYDSNDPDELQRERRALEALQSSPGWSILRAYLLLNAGSYDTQISRTRIRSVEDAFQAAFDQGVVQGVDKASTLLETLIEELRKKEFALREAEEDGRRTDPGGDSDTEPLNLDNSNASP